MKDRQRNWLRRPKLTMAKELAETAKAYHGGEEKQMEGILQRGEWPRPWVDGKLEEVGFEFVD